MIGVEFNALINQLAELDGKITSIMALTGEKYQRIFDEAANISVKTQYTFNEILDSIHEEIMNGKTFDEAIEKLLK